jgi:hypothetical protein
VKYRLKLCIIQGVSHLNSEALVSHKSICVAVKLRDSTSANRLSSKTEVLNRHAATHLCAESFE